MGEAYREGCSGLRLPLFSQPSNMPDGRISNTCKFNHWGLSFLNDGSLRPTFLLHVDV